MDKWFKKKKKHLKTKYEDFIHLRTKKYYYTLGVMKVIKATKGEYYFNSMAYKKALNYHKRTVIIPDARKVRDTFITHGRTLHGRGYDGGII